jgi:uncharacterized peroxidase-related enzyme
VQAHAWDLRAEVRDTPGAQREALLAALARDWRSAPLAPADAALCAYAEKLTLTPRAMVEGDVAALRSAGFDDAAIHHAVQVVAYFNYINRIADAVHVDLEPEMDPYSE